MHFIIEKLECQKNRHRWRRRLEANRKEEQKPKPQKTKGSRPPWPGVDQKPREIKETRRHQQGLPDVLYLLQSSQASPQGIVLSQKPFHLFLGICTLDGHLAPPPWQVRAGPEQRDRTYPQPRKKGDRHTDTQTRTRKSKTPWAVLACKIPTHPAATLKPSSQAYQVQHTWSCRARNAAACSRRSPCRWSLSSAKLCGKSGNPIPDLILPWVHIDIQTPSVTTEKPVLSTRKAWTSYQRSQVHPDSKLLCIGLSNTFTPSLPASENLWQA